MTSTNSNDQTLYFNGVNGATGGYLFEPQTVAEISEIAQKSMIAEQVDGKSSGTPISDETSHLSALIKRHRNKTDVPAGPIEGVDPKNISEAGWGIIFPKNIDPHIRDALSELVNHRQQQAGEYFKEYEVYPGETVNSFLQENQANIFEPADPRKVPYYLLIVGDFQDIPFDFQYQLDVQYAVGRIYFKTPQEYYQYARSVVEAETTNLSLPCLANLFGVRNPDDRATELSADHLVQPLSEFLKSDEIFLKKNSHWKIETHLAEEATKKQLSQLLGGDETPALLFTASHGVGFPNNDPRQLPHQGALVCQEWPGPEFRELIPEDYYFSADDVGDDAGLLGLISFHFACFGAGTPKMDQFGHRRNSWQQIAPYSFVANLPQRLLSHPKGGALAFVSHVDRAWGQSYYWDGKEHINSFSSMLQRIIAGYPIGYAVEFFNERYAAVASELTKELWYIKSRKTPENFMLSYLWTTNNDARGYAIIGDPAVRLMVGNDASKLEKRPEIESVEFSLTPANLSHKPDVTLDPTPPQQIQQTPQTQPGTTEEALSGLVNLLNNLKTRVEQLEQQVKQLQDRDS